MDRRNSFFPKETNHNSDDRNEPFDYPKYYVPVQNVKRLRLTPFEPAVNQRLTQRPREEVINPSEADRGAAGPSKTANSTNAEEGIKRQPWYLQAEDNVQPSQSRRTILEPVVGHARPGDADREAAGPSKTANSTNAEEGIKRQPWYLQAEDNVQPSQSRRTILEPVVGHARPGDADREAAGPSKTANSTNAEEGIKRQPWYLQAEDNVQPSQSRRTILEPVVGHARPGDADREAAGPSKTANSTNAEEGIKRQPWYLQAEDNVQPSQSRRTILEPVVNHARLSEADRGAAGSSRTVINTISEKSYFETLTRLLQSEGNGQPSQSRRTILEPVVGHARPGDADREAAGPSKTANSTNAEEGIKRQPWYLQAEDNGKPSQSRRTILEPVVSHARLSEADREAAGQSKRELNANDNLLADVESSGAKSILGRLRSWIFEPKSRSDEYTNEADHPSQTITTHTIENKVHPAGAPFAQRRLAVQGAVDPEDINRDILLPSMTAKNIDANKADSPSQTIGTQTTEAGKKVHPAGAPFLNRRLVQGAADPEDINRDILLPSMTAKNIDANKADSPSQTIGTQTTEAGKKVHPAGAPFLNRRLVQGAVDLLNIDRQILINSTADFIFSLDFDGTSPLEMMTNLLENIFAEDFLKQLRRSYKLQNDPETVVILSNYKCVHHAIICAFDQKMFDRRISCKKESSVILSDALYKLRQRGP